MMAKSKLEEKKAVVAEVEEKEPKVHPNPEKPPQEEQRRRVVVDMAYQD